MTPQELENRTYPTGKLAFETNYSEENIKKLIRKISLQPVDLEKAIQNLTKEELTYSYRPEGWNVAQIVHHIADSHMNAYIRIKLTLTEDLPTIKPYRENEWAKHCDANQSDLMISVNILKGVHQRMILLLESLPLEAFKRCFHHPDMKRDVPLEQLLSIYAWHGHHHIGHILGARRDKFI